MITPDLSRRVARWINRTNPPVPVRVAIMDASSGSNATDAKLLDVLTGLGVDIDAL